MRTKKTKVSELTSASSLLGLYTLGVDGGNNSVKIPLTWLREASDNLEGIKEGVERATTAANNAAVAAKTATDGMTGLHAEIGKDREGWKADHSSWRAEELARQEAEEGRTEAETGRAMAETIRVESENARVSELDRLMAASKTATAEAARQAAYAKSVGDTVRNGHVTITEAAYNALVDTGTVDPGTFYYIIEEE